MIMENMNTDNNKVMVSLIGNNEIYYSQAENSILRPQMKFYIYPIDITNQ